jgi:hypothetical protein
MCAGLGQGDFFADKMITPAIVNGKGMPAVEIGKISFVFLWETENFIRQGVT